VRVGDEHLRVRVEPGSRLRSTRHAARTVGFATRLDPDDGINIAVVGIGCEGLSESRRGDVAPLSPFRTSSREGNAALVDDELGREAVLAEGIGQGVGVARLIR